jgi:crossover junction endodeoxyribonuclease RusA
MTGPKIVLAWPDSRLSPNARVHWSAKSRAAKSAKSAAFYLARSAGVVSTGTDDSGAVNLEIAFFPPDNRGRDMDNAIASLKSALDGIAQAMGVNDNSFRLSFAWQRPAKPGRVEVVIGGAK